jgi:hypothetical protein
VLFAPAAALPAPLPRLLDGLPVVVPVDDPVVPVDEPVVVPVAVDPPVLEAPPVPLCAEASVLVSASAVANPIVASFMVVIPCLLSDTGPTTARQEMFLA